MSTARWPEFPSDWADTYATLHMWLQVVGKVALAQAAPINHSWAIAMQVTPRGLATRTLPHGDRAFGLTFDFVDHLLVIATSDGDRRDLALVPKSVAAFHREVMDSLDAMRLPVRIWPMPVEIPDPVRFDRDTAHASYDPRQARAFWQVLVQCARVFERSRTGFVGKCSPVHFFWGGCDLAVTRFSGRRAPDREGPAFMREAYSHEVISHGFWPGGGLVPPSFYAYAAPVPEGLEAVGVRPDAAYYSREMGEFLLPYAAVRAAPDPDAALLAFIESTYARAADQARWDRTALETAPLR